MADLVTLTDPPHIIHLPRIGAKFRTLCGLPMADGTRTRNLTLVDLTHPATCPDCVNKIVVGLWRKDDDERDVPARR